MTQVRKNFKLVIEYDGSAYHGWQRQKRDATIQGEIETAIKKLTGETVTINGSGRTDAGVHARGQVANFHCMTRLEAGVVQRGLNALLPEDIVICDVSSVPETFHARYDATYKTYRYVIINRPVPAAIGRQYAWHIQRPLDTGAMRTAMRYLVGPHDFSSFEGTGSPRAHARRTITRAEIAIPVKGRLELYFTANGFLRHMVRNMVGTLVAVGDGKITPEGIETIRKAGDRSLAGVTAPGGGLCLMSVQYEDGCFHDGVD